MTTETRKTLEGREAMARDELDEHIAYNKWDKEEARAFLEEPHDTIHEIADGCVPVYHHDLLEMAAGSNHLGTDEPELGPAFDGAATPVNIIAANVYEALTLALFTYAQELLNNLDDEDEDAATS